MSLRKQLLDILPALLPASPEDSIKGTELIRLTRMQLQGNYSDASVRYHFSIMSCDPSSPIAKVDQGQGYYRRLDGIPALSGAQELLSMTQGRLEGLSQGEENMDEAMLNIQKFRAIVTRYFENNGRFPFLLRETFQHHSPISNLWRYPEIILVDWETEDDSEEEMALDQNALIQAMGISPFQLQAVCLRNQPSLLTYREDFFQTLSVSTWAHRGELIYAAPILDEALAEELRKLSNQFGIGVTSLGLSDSILSELPNPASILNAQARETEAIMHKLDIQRIASAKPRPQLDWPALRSMRHENPEIGKLLQWLGHCVKNRKASPYRAH